MASLITHTVLTDKIFDKYFKDKDQDTFYISTCLPDIRYLKAIKRNQVHFKNMTIKDSQSQDSFLAGLKFHSLIDQTRARFISSSNIFSLCPNVKHIESSLKLLEDELLYEKINDWNKFIDFFDKILDEEISLGIQKKDINKWHQIIQKYFSEQPSDDTRRVFLQSLNFSNNNIKDINSEIEQIKHSQEIIKIVQKLYDNFESIVIQ